MEEGKRGKKKRVGISAGEGRGGKDRAEES